MKRIFCSFSLLGLLLLAGCSAPVSAPAPKLQAGDGQALLTLYLTTSGSSLSAVSYTLDRLALFSDGAWLDLDIPPAEVSREDNRGRQQLLGISLAPTGEHRRLRFRLSNLKIEGQPIAGPAENRMVEVVLQEPVFLESRDSQTLFLDWRLGADYGTVQEILPAFAAHGQQPLLGAGLAYIACAELGTLYVMRIDTNEVVGSIAVPGPLGEIVLDPRLRRLYILSSGRRALFVYDCVKGRFLEQIPLSGTISPRYLDLSTDGEMAFVADETSGLVMKINLIAGVVTAQQRLSHRPGDLLYFNPNAGRVAVLTPSAQQVTMLSADTLELLTEFSVGMKPARMLYFGDVLYVTEQGGNLVATYEYQTGQQGVRVPVGAAPSYLVAIGAQQAWVSNERGRSISVLIPGQDISFRRIPVPAAPAVLEFSQSRNRVYLLSEQGMSVSVIEVAGEQLIKTVDLAGMPTSLALLD